MKSKYDNIKTAAELVAEVAINGFSTEMEDICRAQDIMGHSNDEDFKKIIEDGRKKSYFFFILFKIWNWQEACELWDRLGNNRRADLIKERRYLDEKLAKERNTVIDLEKQLETAKSNAKFEVEQYFKELRRANELAKELDDKEQEIVRLKAKLYDMMESKTA